MSRHVFPLFLFSSFPPAPEQEKRKRGREVRTCHTCQQFSLPSFCTLTFEHRTPKRLLSLTTCSKTITHCSPLRDLPLPDASGQPLNWSTDTSRSPVSGGVVAIGDGFNGNASGTLELTTLSFPANGTVMTAAPQTFPPVLCGSPPVDEYLTGYDATTGLFSSAPLTGGSATGTTASTTNDSYTATQRRTYSLTLAKSFLIWRVAEATGKKFRVRLYSTSLARSNDASRAYTIPLQLGTQHGCILDLYCDQANATTPFMLSPVVSSRRNLGWRRTTSVSSITQPIRPPLRTVRGEAHVS